jgi:hypothetical protein
MSSSSSVALAILKETTAYNSVEATGNFDTLAYVSETLSGDMQVNESAKIGADRQPSGQYVVGQEVGGSITTELTPEPVQRSLILAGMMAAAWSSPNATDPDALTIDVSAGTITAATEDFVAQGFAVNDLIKLSGFSNAKNNATVFVTAVSASTLTVIMANGMVDEVGGGDEVATRPGYAEIGSTRHSFSIAKIFSDLTGKEIAYTGMRVGTLNFGMRYGEAGTIEIGFAGAGHKIATQASEMITNGRTINAASSSGELTAGAHMSFIALDGERAAYCVESLTINLDNAMQAQNCIGSLAPQNQIPNTANITVELSAYLEDENFDLHDLRASQVPLAIGYAMENPDGGYGVYMPEAQLVFNDAQSGGKDQQVMIEMNGRARKGATANALRIYQW